MADAAPAGDRGGFRGGFGDRGRQVEAKFSKPYFYSNSLLLIVISTGEAGAVAIGAAGAVETAAGDVAGARRRR